VEPSPPPATPISTVNKIQEIKLQTTTGQPEGTGRSSGEGHMPDMRAAARLPEHHGGAER
jgi:hypothetical protein